MPSSRGAAFVALRRTGFAFAAAGGIGWLALALVHASLGPDPWIAIPTRGDVTRVPTRLLQELLAPRRLDVSAPLLFLIAGAASSSRPRGRAERRRARPSSAACSTRSLELRPRVQPVTPRHDVFPENAMLRHLGAHLGRERVVAAGTTLRPNVAMVFGFRDLRATRTWSRRVRAHLPAHARAAARGELASEPAALARGGTPAPARQRPIPSEHGRSSPAAPYRLAHARTGSSCGEPATLRARSRSRRTFRPDAETARASLLAPDFDPFREVILTGEGPARGTPGTAPPVTWRTDEPEKRRARVTLPAPGHLVLGDRHAPEWQATVDGEAAPILRANGAFRAVALPAGTHEVRFTYRPRLVYGSAATSAALLVVLGLVASTPQRRPRRPHESRRRRTAMSGRTRPSRARSSRCSSARC